MKNESCKCSYKKVGLSVETASNYSEAIEGNTKGKKRRISDQSEDGDSSDRTGKHKRSKRVPLVKKELSWLVSRIIFIFSITDVYN